MRFKTALKSATTLSLAAAVGQFLAVAVLGQTSDASRVPMQEAVIKPALDGIFEAFETYPLVGLGDVHGLMQGEAFYEELIRDPRFAREVRNVVVEFGGAAHQDLVDRYVNGESVPYTELRRVWTDTVGWVPTVTSMGLAHFFYHLRLTNLSLPPDERIRVWLGEPPIDWSKIETNEEWLEIARERDSHAAAVIVENILERDDKALVIYGSGHFEPLALEERAILKEWIAADQAALSVRRPNLQKVIELDYPDVFFVAQVYIGFHDEACTARFEQRMQDWVMPALAVPVLGTALERALRECLGEIEVDDSRSFPPQWPQALQDYARAYPDDHRLFQGDAVLFHGPAATLTNSPRIPDIYMDEAYHREISRRYEIMSGRPLAADYMRNYPSALPWTQREGEGVPDWARRTEIDVSPAVLEQYAGTYTVSPGLDVVIKIENGLLTTQATGQPKVELFAEAEDMFFMKIANVQTEFVRNESGDVVALIMHAGEQEIRAERR